MVVMANEVKTKGVSLFDKLFEKAEEVIINVRGKNKYVVIDMERYKELRAMELDKAYDNAMADIKAGRYTTDVDAHLHEIHELANEL
jgi:PHD/YefM family antitoxin component YafN of YafNO toxin-antitoxin module